MNQHSKRRRRSIGTVVGHRKSAAAAVVAAAVAVATVGTAPAQSAPGGPGAPVDPTECPPAAASVTAGEAVTGKTTTSGITPEGFTGEVVGVLEDYLGPDLDLIVVRLTSTEIDKAGIWAGMSGSPVYNAAGQLIGAVSYGFSYGPSPVAGVTPAARMLELLTTAPTDAAAAAALEAASERDEIALPQGLKRELVTSGAATAAEVNSGMARLPLPLGVSGMASTERLDETVKRLGLKNVRPYKTGAVSAASTDYPIVSGGNLAASLSYGDVTAAGVGTATAVCGSEVVAFGHPMMFSGASTLALHGATGVYVQEDPAWVSYKQVNVGGPSGSIAQDRGAGLLGIFGTLPVASDITSTVTMGATSRTGTTKINVPDYVADLSFSHFLTDLDVVFDAYAKGAMVGSWTVKGTRENGDLFEYTRGDRFASAYDITAESAWQLAEQLYRLQYNGSEEIEFTEIDTTSALDPVYKRYVIKNVQIKAGGRWSPVRRSMRLKAGAVSRFLVTLTSAQLPTKQVRLGVKIPSSARGRYGSLEILGGNSYYGEEEYYDYYEPMSSGQSVDKILKDIKYAPRNDVVMVRLRMRGPGGTLKRETRVRTDAVVDGMKFARVRATR